MTFVKLEYALTVWESLHPDDQPRHWNALFEAHGRTGGVSAVTNLAFDLLSRDEELMKSAGVAALQRTYGRFKVAEDRNEWLRSLPPEYLLGFESNQLPEDLRPVEAAP